MTSRALIVDADPALLGLLEEWLGEGGWSVQQERTDESPAGDYDLIVADLPFPRHGSSALLRRLADENPGTPIVVLSSNFFPGIDAAGAVAKGLGVAAVLPKPVSRDALLAAVDRARVAVR